MAQASPLVYQVGDPERLQSQVFWTTAILGASYSGILAVLERALPIKPTWVALEVVGGVLLVGLPVRWIAQRSGSKLTWRDYERLVITGFVGAGAPILIWQAIEYGVLQQGRIRQESGEEPTGA
jgi:protein-S-isoprenylcysteine O-methyltransferase Ste14